MWSLIKEKIAFRILDAYSIACSDAGHDLYLK